MIISMSIQRLLGGRSNRAGIITHVAVDAIPSGVPVTALQREVQYAVDVNIRFM